MGWQMKTFDWQFLDGMRDELGVQMIGVISVGQSNSNELKERTNVLLPETKSVVVLAHEIFKEVVSLLRPSKEIGEADSGDLLRPHSDYVDGRLNHAVHQLAIIFRKNNFKSLPLPAAAGFMTDQRFLANIFSYKQAAQLAGLGSIGRHSLLITPEFGSRVRLACVLTEAQLEPSATTVQSDRCINCNACIRACPAGALQVPRSHKTYSINKFACRSYRQVGVMCSVCLRACDEALG
jgi:epoxyqueuosine reductase QueG